MKLKQRFSCPNCNHFFTWTERWTFAKYGGLIRKTVVCPDCKTTLIWEKKSWIIMNTGAVAVLIYLGVTWFGPENFHGSSPAPRILFFVLMGILIIASRALRIIKADQE